MQNTPQTVSPHEEDLFGFMEGTPAPEQSRGGSEVILEEVPTAVSALTTVDSILATTVRQLRATEQGVLGKINVAKKGVARAEEGAKSEISAASKLENELATLDAQRAQWEEKIKTIAALATDTPVKVSKQAA